MPGLTVVTPYGHDGASSRVRVYDWLAHLGIERRAAVYDYRGAASNRPRSMVREASSAVAAEARTRRLRPGDGSLLLSREASPLSSGRLEARLLHSAGRGVYDVDDALFHDRPRKAATFARAVAAADVVIAGNDYLAERAARTAREVVVVPSCVEPGRYQPKRSYALGARPRLVWVGSAATELYLSGVAPSLLEVHRRTGARLRVVSAGAASLGPLDAMVDRVAWSLETAADELAAADVALGPLSDTPYARGKCAYKLLQYAASGLPMVASPVGANRRALELLGGSAATSTAEWVDALVELLEAATGTRESRGRLARHGVEAHYSFARWADVWRTAVGV